MPRPALPPGVVVPPVAPDPDADARALASTLRLRILRLCLDEPRTNRELAEALARNPGSTLHHVRTLADRGFLVALPPRRGTRGAREVPYLATGRSWETDLPEGAGRAVVDVFLDELAESPASGTTLVRMGLRLTPAQHDDLVQEVLDVVARYRALDVEGDPDAEPYGLFWATYDDVRRRSGPA